MSTASPRASSSARKSRPARRRLTAEQARERILAAAEKKLGEVGPEGLRLTELAMELGISHPAILHHFGSREELVGAVLAQAMTRLNERLTEVSRGSGGREAALDVAAEFCSTQGNARLIAWLVLSGRTPKQPRTRTPAPLRLQDLIARSHEQREQAHPGRKIELEDTRFRSQLMALALLGDAVFGDLIRLATGEATGPESSRAFRRRLAKLLRETW